MATATGAAERDVEKVWRALDGFRIEVPSWGFANTGTRFGKFVQGGAATTIEEKFSDAGAGECSDGGESDGGAACALGSAGWGEGCWDDPGA